MSVQAVTDQAELQHRLGLIFMVGLVARTKFYFAWAISEASLIMSGFCFNGYTEQVCLLNFRTRSSDVESWLPQLHRHDSEGFLLPLRESGGGRSQSYMSALAHEAAFRRAPCQHLFNCCWSCSDGCCSAKLMSRLYRVCFTAVSPPQAL